MKKQLRLIMLTLLCAVAGTMWGQEKTYDFTDKSWSVSNGTLSSTNTKDVFTGSGSKWEINGQGYFIFGKSGATLNLPVFDFGVEKIVVVGNKNASQYVKMNVYVGSNAVSTETTGCGNNSGPFTLTYEISEGGQAAGNQYTLMVTNAYNAQITKIFVYKKEGDSPIAVSAPTFSPAAGAVKAKTPVTIKAAEGCTLSYTVNGVAQTSASNIATVSPTVPTTIKAKAVKKGVESDEVTATYTISVAAPTFSPAAGAVAEGTEVTITSPDAASMRFTVDDGEPSTITAGTIEHTVNKATTLKAVAIDAYGNESEEVEASYTILLTGAETATVDFENDASSYTFWNITNIVTQEIDENGNVSPHGGSYFGNTDKKETGSITTKEKVVAPISLTCYVSKESNNTTTSNWYIQVSSDGNNWTNVSSISASSMGRGEWKELTADLSELNNVFVRVYYEGTSALRDIDDVQLVYVPGKKVPELSWSESTIVMNVGETRDFPTLICPEGVERDNATSSKLDVVNLDARDNGDGTWTLLLKALSEGTSVITVNTKENADYLAGKASFTVTVVDPTVSGTEATYVFNQGEENYGSGMRPDVGGNDIVENLPSTWTSGKVTMVADGRYKWHMPSGSSTPEDLRFYKKVDTTNSYPSMTFSVPSGYNIIKIEFTESQYGSSLNNWTVDGTYVNKTWQGKAQSVVFENKSDETIHVQTVTVTYIMSPEDAPVIWMTYSSANDLDFTNAKAYTAFVATNYKSEEKKVVLTKIKEVPAGVGIVIRSNDPTVGISSIFSEDDVLAEETDLEYAGVNMLVGKPDGGAVESEGVMAYDNDTPAYHFILAKREGVVGFYKLNAGNLPANRAYLQIPKTAIDTESSANGISFAVEGEETAIQSVTTATADDAWYTLQGVRVAQPTRGLYIHNGKKVVVK